jgi:hypothetical protein
MNTLQAAAAEYEAYYASTLAPVDVLRFQAVRCLKSFDKGESQWGHDDHWGSIVECSFGLNGGDGVYTVILQDPESGELVELFEGELLEKASEPSLQDYLGADLPQVIRRVLAK